MYLSSSATIWRGVNSSRKSPSGFCECVTSVATSLSNLSVVSFAIPTIQLEHCYFAIRIDADIGGDLERLAHDLRRRQRRVDLERAGSRQCVARAAADRNDRIVRLDHVAIATN